MNRNGSIAYAAMAGILISLVLAAPAATAWTGAVTLEGATDVEGGENITIGVSFTSTTWTEVKVTNVSLWFDWMPFGEFVYSKVVPVNVGPNGSYVFYFSVAVPENDAELGSHDVEARIFVSDPKEPSGWDIAYSQVYHLQLTYADNSDGWGICGPVWTAIAALAAAPFVLVAAVRTKRQSR